MLNQSAVADNLNMQASAVSSEFCTVQVLVRPKTCLISYFREFELYTNICKYTWDQMKCPQHHRRLFCPQGGVPQYTMFYPHLSSCQTVHWFEVRNQPEKCDLPFESVQTTAVSSKCWQLWRPIPLWEQEMRVEELVKQLTLSSKIGPVPCPYLQREKSHK